MATYNPKDINFAVSGIPVTGYADGTDVIMVDCDTDSVGDAVGVTGEAAFVEHNDGRGTVTFKLLATALMNDIFSGLHAAKTEFALSGTDARGTTIVAGAACRIKKLPAQAFGNEIGNRVWEIRVLELVEHVGGNTG